MLPAVARDGDVTVAVGTGGTSPALASHLRGEIEIGSPDRCAGAAATSLRTARRIRANGESTESVDWTADVHAALASPTEPPSTTEDREAQTTAGLRLA